MSVGTADARPAAVAVTGRFWRNHALWPLLAFAALAPPLAVTGLDRAVAEAWAWSAETGRFIGAGPGEWWARKLLHAGGGAVVRLLGAAVLLGLLASRWHPASREWSRPLAYATVAGLAVVTLVGILKNTTNVDCPWSLSAYGGDRPYVHLLADRPDDLPRARCFPGGHSASGFALFALYFALRDRRPRAARTALAAALATGAVFALGQEARGAHFLSHDLWSAGLAWFTCLAVYTLGFGGRV